MVQAGAPLIEIGDPSALEVVVDVLSADAVRIEVGAEARIERWGGEVPLRARVSSKQPRPSPRAAHSGWKSNACQCCSI